MSSKFAMEKDISLDNVHIYYTFTIAEPSGKSVFICHGNSYI